MADIEPYWLQPSKRWSPAPYEAPTKASQQLKPGCMYAQHQTPTTDILQHADERSGVVQGANLDEGVAVFVKGFPKHTGSPTLRALFQLYGNVTRIYIPAPLEQYDNPQKPYGVVYYDNKASAQLAVEKHSGHRPAYILEHELDSLPQESQPYGEFWQQESVILHVELYDIQKKGKKHSLFVDRATKHAKRDRPPYSAVPRLLKPPQAIVQPSLVSLRTHMNITKDVKREHRGWLFEAGHSLTSAGDDDACRGATTNYRPEVQAYTRSTERLPRTNSLAPGMQVEVERTVAVDRLRDSGSVPPHASTQSRLLSDSHRAFVSAEVPRSDSKLLRLENDRLKAELAALQSDDKLYISDEETHFSKETLLQILNAQRHEMHYRQWQLEQKQEAQGQLNNTMV